MTIRIHTKEVKLFLLLPTAWFLNRATVAIAAKAINNALPEANIMPSDLFGLIEPIKACKRQYGRLELVNVQAANGDKVLIRL